MLNYLNNLKPGFIFCTLLALSCSAFGFEYGDPTSLEQAHLEAINRARLNPLQEAQHLGIDLFEGIPSNILTSSPKQPLSFNALLLKSARNHSMEMLNENYFDHNNSANQSPFDRFEALPYDYLTATENIAMSGLTSMINDVEVAQTLHDNLFIDHEYHDRAHRTNLLNPAFREVGIGLSFGIWHENGNNFNSAMVSTDFGTRKDNRPIILGVVYEDTNHNGIYDAGEGIPNVKVAISQGIKTQTATAGGYGLEVDYNRDYLLTFTHPRLGSIDKSVRVDDLNIKVDVLSSEFPTNNVISQHNNEAGSVQQCLTFNQNKLFIPCINAAGSVYSVELKTLDQSEPISNSNSPQFGIHSITAKKLSTATACEVYDQRANKAYLSCIQIDNHNYRAELTIQSSLDEPVFELKTFDDMLLFFQ